MGNVLRFAFCPPSSASAVTFVSLYGSVLVEFSREMERFDVVSVFARLFLSHFVLSFREVLWIPMAAVLAYLRFELADCFAEPRFNSAHNQCSGTSSTPAPTDKRNTFLEPYMV